MASKSKSKSSSSKTTTAKTTTAAVKTTNSGTKSGASGRVVGSTTEIQKKEVLIGSDVVTLRVSLRHPIRFDDIPDGDKKKTVVLPGLDDALKGEAWGILTPEGNAIFYQIKRTDWEAIQKMYGELQAFHSFQGRPPLVAVVESVSAAKSGSYREDIEATNTSLGQQDPYAVGVKEAED